MTDGGRPRAGEPGEPPATRVVLRPFATPLPLAFLALAVGTSAVSCEELGWVSPAAAHDIALGLLLVVAPLQLLASVFGFFARDPAAGTGMALLSGSWATVGFNLFVHGAGLDPGLGVLLVAAGIALTVPAAAAALSKPLASAVIATAAARFALTGAYDAADVHPLKVVAAGVGLFLGALAWYAALAFELEGVRHHPVLPTFRIAGGRRAMAVPYDQEVEGVVHEPGVRQQL